MRADGAEHSPSKKAADRTNGQPIGGKHQPRIAVWAVHARLGGEERDVSILFADLAGSTALGEKLDPEDVRELRVLGHALPDEGWAVRGTSRAEEGLAAIEAGADDVQVDGKSVEITTPPGSFEKVKASMEGMGVTIDNAEITMQPKQTVAVGEDKAAAVLRMMESLEEDDDVQQVYANFDIPTNVLERVSAQV